MNNRTMADKKQTSMSEGESEKVVKGEEKSESEAKITDKSTDMGKPKADPTDSKESKQGDELQEALKQRDGTISALDKKNQELTEKINRLEGGLKEAIGIGTDSEEVSLEDDIRQMRSELESLKKEKRVNQIADSLVTDEGFEMPEIVKKKAVEALDLENIPLEKVESAIKKQAEILLETYQADRKVSSSEPEKDQKRTASRLETDFVIKR